MNLESTIEAILFFKGEPINKSKLAKILNVSKEDLDIALVNLENSLSSRGIVLRMKEDEIFLGTNPELSDLIEGLQKEELNKDLSRASLETLSIILYKNGATRSEIDYIRGVNSNFILRNLSVRGLIEKIIDPTDQRRHIFKPSFELLGYLGISKIEDLPEYNTNYEALQNIKEQE